MKKLLVAALLGLGLVLQTADQASAYTKFGFSAGVNLCWESANNCVLWGALQGGPGPYEIPVGPEVAVAEPAVAHAAPQAVYPAPQAGHAAPQPAYPAPQGGYNYSAPQGGYGTPAPTLPVLPSPNQGNPGAGQQNAQPVGYYQQSRQYNQPAYQAAPSYYAPSYYAPSYWYNNR